MLKHAGRSAGVPTDLPTPPVARDVRRVSAIESRAVAFAQDDLLRFAVDRLVLTCQARGCSVPSRLMPRLEEVKHVDVLPRSRGAAARIDIDGLCLVQELGHYRGGRGGLSCRV